MPESKYLKWNMLEHTTTHSTTSAGWELQREEVPAEYMTPGNDYFIYAWANCFSPGTNDGGTKWAFIGGDDLGGSTQERYDTNSSGMAICHVGSVTAPDPMLPIGIYRRRLEDGGEYELTKSSQFFILDITDMGGDTILFDHANNYSLREIGIGGTLQALTPSISGGAKCLVVGSAKVYGGDATPTKLGLYHDGNLVSSGSRYSVDSQDNNQVVLGGVYNFTPGESFSIRNIDESTSATTSYTYLMCLNLGESAAESVTGTLTSWTDLGGSGKWTPTSASTDSGPSFVFAFARQQATGVGEGRQASISVRNNTKGVWMNFPSRPSGEFSPHYFPATEVGSDRGQYSTAAVVGIASDVAPVSSGDEIQLYTI